jgi:hypothetical protein
MVLSIPPDLATDFAKVQGEKDAEGNVIKSGNAGACKGGPKNVKSMIKADPGGKKMADIAKSIGMNETCQKASTAYSDQSMTDVDTMAGAISIFGGGMASNSTTVTNNINDSAMQEKGCGSFAVAASTIMNETASISCTLNSTLTGQTTEVNQGARITVKTKRPSQAAIALILESTNKQQANIAAAAIKDVVIRPGTSDAVAQMKFDAKQKMIDGLTKALEKHIEENPTSADLVDSTINARINSKVKLKSEQKITVAHQNKIGDSIKSIAAAAAEQKMSADLGFQASSANSKQLIQQRVNNIFESEKTSIDEKITNSFTKAVSSNEILIEIEGAIRASDLNLDMMVQTNVQTSQAVKSGISIGHRVAAELGSEVIGSQEDETKSDGFNDLVKAANDGLANQIKAKGESDAASLGAMGEAMGGMFSGMFLLMLLPLIIILGVLFFAPKLISGFIPPQLKVPLMIGLVILIVLLVLYYMGVFSSESRRSFPNSTEFMSVDDELADTLGYMVTETKGPINKKPYEDFNFTAGGTWLLD